MSALDDARDRFVAHSETLRETLRSERSEPAWLDLRRAEAIAAFASAGLPTTRLEEWRYTSVAPLAKRPFAVAPERELTRDDLEELATPLFACSLFAFANGRFRADLSSQPSLPGGARCESLAALLGDDPGAIEDHFGLYVDAKQHPFAALNTACTPDGAVVRVPRGDAVEQPIHLVFASIGGEEPAVTHPRVVVVAEADSQVTIVQDHVSKGDSPDFTNSVTEIHVGANAQVHWISLQREHDGQFHVSNLQVYQARNSRFTAHTLTLGGALVRNDVGALLAEEGAECRLDGLFVAGGERLIDNHTLVDHAVPHCASHELYKGVLGGKAPGASSTGASIVRPGRPEDGRHASRATATCCSRRRRRDRHQAPARDPRRRREVQPRLDHRPARRGRALLPARARHRGGGGARVPDPRLRFEIVEALPAKRSAEPVADLLFVAAERGCGDRSGGVEIRSRSMSSTSGNAFREPTSPILAHQEVARQGRSCLPRQRGQQPRSRRQVIDALSALSTRRDYANIHRGGAISSPARPPRPFRGRPKTHGCGAFSASTDPREIVFVRNATEAINLVAVQLGPPAPSCSGDESADHRRWSTTRTSFPGRCCATEKGARPCGSRPSTTAASAGAGGASRELVSRIARSLARR